MSLRLLPGCHLSRALSVAIALAIPLFGQVLEIPRLSVDTGQASSPDATGQRTSAVRLRAVVGSDAPAPQVQGPVAIRAEILAPPGLIITEVALDGSAVEFMNPGAEVLDLSGWLLHAGSGPLESIGSADLFLPPATILSPGGILVWTTSTNPHPAATVFRHPRPFRRPHPLDVEVRDATGQIVDQLFLTPSADSREQLWAGSPAPITGLSTGSVARRGSANSHSAQDWSVVPSSLGQPNPELIVPWTGIARPIATQPAEASMVLGVWEGLVRFNPGEAPAWTLVASLPGGAAYASAAQDLTSGPRLRLEWITGNGNASEAASGKIGRVRVRLPDPTPAALVVTLQADVPGEFDFPATVQIPGGASEAGFDVTNLDDTFADGDARIRLSAGAPGFGPASLVLLNVDNEANGTLHVQLPDGRTEGAGLLAQPGLVSLASPAIHDVVVRLEARGRMQTPGSIVIPRGANSAPFPVVLPEDNWVNAPPTDDSVRALTGTWPAATASMPISDNESPAFTWTTPNPIVEGQTNELILTFVSAADKPLTVWFNPSGTDIGVPDSVVLPAGEKELRLNVVPPEDPISFQRSLPMLCPRTGLFDPGCRQLGFFDNDQPVDEVRVVVPNVTFLPDPVPISIATVHASGRVLQYTGPATVRVMRPLGGVEIPVGEQQITIREGRFEGTLPLNGVAPAVELEVTFQGITGRSPVFALIQGKAIPGTVLDVAAWPGRTTLLTLQHGTNGVTPVTHLVELDPNSGSTLRQLPLPQPAHRIDVSESGSTAWLASDSNSVQRIDLVNWTHSGEVGLAVTSGVRNGLLLAIAKGTEDDLLVLTKPASEASAEPFQLVGIRGGQRLNSAYPLAPAGDTAALAALTAAGEFISALSRDVHRVRLATDGVVGLRTRNVSTARTRLVHAALLGETVIFGGGHAIHAGTLEDQPSFTAPAQASARTAVLPMPEMGKVLFADVLARVLTIDALSRTNQGELPYRPLMTNTPPADRMVRWGASGVALVSWQDGRLFLVTDPVRLPARADLGVTLTLPARVPWQAGSTQPGRAQATITVTNRGPDRVEWVNCSLSSQQVVQIPTLAPGESVELTPMVNFSVTGSNRLSVRVATTTATSDPVPDNDIATADTYVEPLVWPGEVTIDLAARHLIAKPGGSELWVACGPERGAEGIALIDPVSGAVKRHRPIGPNPRRLAAEGDGTGVYALVGTNRIVRWNLATDAVDIDISFPAEQVVDLAAIQDQPGLWAALFQNRLEVFNGSAAIQTVPLPGDAARSLATIGNQLWIARTSEIRIYASSPGGLELLKFTPLNRGSSDYRFNTDGGSAAFNGLVFNPTSRGNLQTDAGGAPILPGPGLLFFNAVRHRLRTLTHPTLGLVDETFVASLYRGPAIEDQVRWGAHGFAFRNAAGAVISVQEPINRDRNADLAVGVEAVGTPYYLQPSVFRLIVTNRGPDAVSRARIEVSAEGANSILSDPPALHEEQRVIVPVGLLAPGEVRSVLVTLLPGLAPRPTSALTLIARAASEGVDPTTLDASLRRTFAVPAGPANLGLHLTLPAQMEPGREFVVECTVTNRGPSAVPDPRLKVAHPPHFTWLGSDGGASEFTTGTDTILSRLTPRLEPGTAVQVRLRFRANGPGVSPLVVSAVQFVDDSDLRDNVARTSLHVPAANGETRQPHFSVGFTNGRWSASRQQWILTDPFGLTFLDPLTLAPMGNIQFGREVGRMIFNPEGSHVWFDAVVGGIERWNLATGSPDLTIPAAGLTDIFASDIAAVEGRPDLLVQVSLSAEMIPIVRVFNGATALPATFAEQFEWSGLPLRVFANAAGRVFVNTSYQFAEFDLVPDGLRYVQGAEGGFQGLTQPMSVVDDLLVYVPEFLYDLRTLQGIGTSSVISPAFDHLLYDLYNPGDGTRVLRALDTRSRGWIHRRHQLPPATYLPAGLKGLLALGPNGGRVPLPAASAPDLRLAVGRVPLPAGAGREFEIPFTLHQSEGWQATEVRIQTTLPPGIELVAPASSGAPGGFSLPPRSDGITPFTIRLRANTTGPARIGIEAISPQADPTPDDARQVIDLYIPATPVLLLVDQVVADNGAPLDFQLSETAPTPMTFVLEAEHVTTQPTDLQASRIEVRFPAGSRRAKANWVTADARVEADEVFRARLVEGPVPATTGFATITIRNDDRALLRALGGSRAEGSSGVVPVPLTAWLDTPIDTPVEVEFSTVDGTAIAGQDYLPVSGRLRFTPEARTNQVSIQVIGDTENEPAESFGIGWRTPIGVNPPDPSPTLFTLLNDDTVSSPILDLTLEAAQQAVLRFESQSGVRYTLQSRGSLGEEPWASEGPAVTGTGGVLEIRAIVRPDDTRFYRVLVE